MSTFLADVVLNSGSENVQTDSGSSELESFVSALVHHSVDCVHVNCLENDFLDQLFVSNASCFVDAVAQCPP